MDATILQATLSFVALVLFYSFWSSRSKNRAEKKIQAPKPNGAGPILGHLPLLRGTDPACRILAEMADEYGPVLRIQLGLQHALVVSGKEALRQIFTTNDLSFMNRPKAFANSAFFALTPYGPFWQEVRKIGVSGLLSNTRLELMKPVRALEMTTCIRELYSVCCKNGIVGPVKFNIGKWLQQVVMNMLMQMMARKRYSSIGKGATEMELRIFRKAYEDFFATLDPVEMSDIIPFTEWMDLKGNQRAMERTVKELDFILSSWLEEHKQSMGNQGQLKETPDLIDVMLSLSAESDGFLYGHKFEDVIKANVSVSHICYVLLSACFISFQIFSQKL